MVRVSNDNDGAGFSVTPNELSETSSVFYKAASDTFDLQTSLTTDANQLIASMSSILNQSPDSLRRFFNRWSTAIGDLSNSLDTVGYNLYEASVGYQDADDYANKAFKGHHNKLDLP